MNNLIEILVGLTAGLLIGYLYFLGLWWTVGQIPVSKTSYGLVLGSFVIRSLLAGAGFYLLLLLGWEVVAVGLIGFIISRHFLIRYWGLSSIDANINREAGDGIKSR